MHGNEVTMKTLQVSINDFICNRENVLKLLSQSGFYDACDSFKQLQPHVLELSEFVKKHNMVGVSAKKKPSCSKCDMWKVYRAQKQLIEGFAKIFFWLYDNNKLENLRQVLKFACAVEGKKFTRLILASSQKTGKGKKEANRVAIVE